MDRNGHMDPTYRAYNVEKGSLLCAHQRSETKEKPHNMNSVVVRMILNSKLVVMRKAG